MILRFIILFLCVIALFSLSACSKAEPTVTRKEITVNLPQDDSVNGYRTELNNETVTTPNKNNSLSNSSKENSKKEENNISSQTKPQENQPIQYCANTNSKKFHISSCGSVATIKEENRLYLSDRNEMINLGYQPCKRCNP